jgi:glycosyltransferase involved in cell wall biosynthesis
LEDSIPIKGGINIIAVNIKIGGGLELLLYLVEYIKKKWPQIKFRVYVDISIQILQTGKNVEVIHMSGSLQKIKLFSKKIDNSIYFGNLPPLVKSENSMVYFHNQYLIMPFAKLIKISFKFAIKYTLQQIYVRFYIKNVDIVACQNEDIKSKFIEKYLYKKVKLYPFFRTCDKDFISKYEKIYDFCYVSLAYPHKNHQRLIEACEILLKENIEFSLALTIEDGHSELISKIEEINRLDVVKITNLGKLSKEEVCKLYAKSRSLIFPSTEETFGLALVEAIDMNLDVIASDLEYVYQSIQPSLVFDPLDVNSIASVIKQYLAGNTQRSKSKIENKIENLIEFLVKGK